jgi:2-amino-4-hydroxy-6-hydroxymethyldihydropteridine diphosphokinase
MKRRASHQVTILLGSNLGNRQLNIDNACFLIEERIGILLSSSSLYQTKAWGVQEQPDFYNKVIICQTELLPEETLQECLSIEKTMGRVRNEKWSSRTLDIDILYFDREILAKKHLKIPHPFLHERRFTLVPLCELMADFVHPVLNMTNRMLLEKCSDELDVVPIEK